MIGFLVRGRVRIKIRIRVRVRVGVTFNVRVYHWSNCRRSKCRTFIWSHGLQMLKGDSTQTMHMEKGFSEQLSGSFMPCQSKM